MPPVKLKRSADGEIHNTTPVTVYPTVALSRLHGPA